MPRRSSPYPTEAELEILGVLWDRGPCTVRQVHETLQARGPRETALTTTLKLLQVMETKGLVVRGDGRPARFEASTPQEQTQAGLLADLAQRAFDGSMGKLLVRAVEEARLSPKDLAELRKLIDRARKPKEGR